MGYARFHPYVNINLSTVIQTICCVNTILADCTLLAKNHDQFAEHHVWNPPAVQLDADSQLRATEGPQTYMTIGSHRGQSPEGCLTGPSLPGATDELGTSGMQLNPSRLIKLAAVASSRSSWSSVTAVSVSSAGYRSDPWISFYKC